jgi:hypothetical protein
MLGSLRKVEEKGLRGGDEMFFEGKRFHFGVEYNNIMEKKMSAVAEKASAHFRHSKDTGYNWPNAQMWKSERMASMGNP